MNMWIDIPLVLLILTSFGLLGASRLGTCIRIVAIQGIATGLLPLAEILAHFTWRVAAIGLGTVVLKGVVFPFLLSRALRESNTSREVQPLIGNMASLMLGVLALAASFWLDAQFDLPAAAGSELAEPVAFSVMMTGLLLIIGRKTAVNQVLGYLVLENGIYTLGFTLVPEIPVLVELGVLMDVFVAVFVMGIAIYRINREFDHIDSDQLNSLKG
jgi:hydrogenase-4 component E